MKNKKLSSLGRSLRIGCVVSVLIICLLMGTAGFGIYYRGMIRQYQTYLTDLLELIQTEVDGDDLAQCIETGRESDKFLKTQAFVDRLKEIYEIEYIYIVKPLNTDETDNMMNVMAAVTAAEREEDEEFYSVTLSALTGEDYSSEVAAKYLAGMTADQTTFFSNRTELGHDYTGMIPIVDSGDQPVAVLAVDLSMSEIFVMLWRYILILCACILVLSVASMTAIYVWLHRRVIEPIERLNTSVDNYEHGSFALDMNSFKADDELRNLATSFTDMTHRIDAYTDEVAHATAEKERISAEFNVANQIQTDIMPNEFPAFPDHTDFDIYAYMSTSREIGGDFYDYFLIDEDHLGLVMGDVSDKGVPAAMFMVITKTLIKNRALQGFSPAEVLQSVSEQLAEGNNSAMFAAVWMAVLELSTGKGVAANAGQEHPILRRAGKRFEQVKYRHSPPVGAMEGIRFREHEFQLGPGDTLFVHTDGIAEVVSAQNGTFGDERIMEALNREPDATPSVLLQTVQFAVEDFSGGESQSDDVTMMAVKYYGPGNPSDTWR